MIVTIPASFDRVSTRKDRTLGIGISTQELDSVEKVQVLDMVGQFGWFCFSTNAIDEKDIPKEDAVGDGKTPSQRLRGVIYCYYEQLGGRDKKGDFEVFYRRQMDAIIDKYKSKLD